MMKKTQVDALKHFLHTGIAQVTFKKANGDLRVMNCTLVPEYMKVDNVQEKYSPKRTNEDVQAVWDLDNNGWRSFRFDTVQKVKIDDVEVSYV